MKKKILTLLALLLTAVTGAWADEVTIGENTNNTTSVTPTNSLWGYSFVEQIYTASEIGTSGTITSISFHQSSANGGNPSAVAIYMKHVNKETFGSTDDYETVSASDKVWEGTLTYLDGGGWITFTLDTPFEYNGTDNLLIACYETTQGYSSRYFYCTDKNNSVLSFHSDSAIPDPYNLGSYTGNKYVKQNRANIKINIGPGTEPEPPIEVTWNADMTEASFDMPANDLTVDYELVRDMSVDMTVSVEDAQGKSSIRLKKMGSGKYEPADMTPQQMAGLITVTDDIEGEELTNNTDYTVSIFAVDDNDQPTGTAIAFADLTPGRYVAFATAKEGTIYDGQTLPSNIFKLFVGYEVEVGAESFATFYKDEKLTVEESSTTGELYTISSVSADEAVLSAQIGVAPANTPLLVYNSGSEKKTILLIVTDGQADNVTAYGGFKGTLVASTIAASTNDQTNYALNGKQFVWVKNALSIAANKCWLEVVNSNARALSILFTGETTGIATATRTEATGDLYDLNGRKVLNPTRKGIYIQNGKKVVIK